MGANKNLSRGENDKKNESENILIDEKTILDVKELIGEKKIDEMPDADIIEIAKMLKIEGAEGKESLVLEINKVINPVDESTTDEIPADENQDNKDEEKKGFLGNLADKITGKKDGDDNPDTTDSNTDEVDSKLKCPTCYSLMKERKKDYVCTNKDCKRVEKKQVPEKKDNSEKKEVAKNIDKKLGKCPVCLSGMKIVTVKVPNSEATKAYLECTDTACRKRLEK